MTTAANNNEKPKLLKISKTEDLMNLLNLLLQRQRVTNEFVTTLTIAVDELTHKVDKVITFQDSEKIRIREARRSR